MKELRDILHAYDEAQRRAQPTALITVVKVSGSSYRRPGARMLVSGEGVLAGSVSGGCLEADVIRQARDVLRDGQPRLVTYNTTDDRDIVFGVGLGCRGVIDILIEPCNAESMAFLAGLVGERRPGVLATLFRTEDDTSTHIGQRLMLGEEGQDIGSVTPPELAECLRRDALEALRAEASCVQTYSLPNGTAEAFLEFVAPPLSLVVCGAGPDAGPLARLAKEMGWHVTVWDERPGVATSERFPQADLTLACAPECLPERLAWNGRTAAVLTTHNYLRDLKLLEVLLPFPLPYLGVLGPRRRTEQMLADLRRDGVSLPDDLPARLHGPAGLDIGAGAPEQIALAIVAEIQAVCAGRSGGLLRDRPGPIYAAPNVEGREKTGAGDMFTCPLSA